MKIVVDLLGFTGERGGTESYARELLTRLPDHLPGAQFHALTGRAGVERLRAFFPGPIQCIDWVDTGRSRWAAGEILSAERFARRAGADVIWCPSNFGPLRAGIPRLTTIHDVIYHEVGRHSPGRAVTSCLMARTARTASRVLTVSHAAARAIHRHLEVPTEHISVVHNGCSEPPMSPVEPWGVLSAISVAPGRRIVLSTGNRMPHKNFEGLLRAIATLPPERRPLTVIPGGHGADPLSRVVSALGLDHDVVLPGWVTKEQLEALYAVADLYVCPSLTEGFGLPVVDALRRGCAVLANDVDVLREVGGDVTEYADASDASAFGSSIEACLNTTPRSDEAAAAARVEWAKQFSWQKAASGTADALQRVFPRSFGQQEECA